jgi:hypothetical protein
MNRFLIVMFFTLFLGKASLAAPVPTSLVLVRITPVQGNSYFGLFPYSAQTVSGETNGPIRELIFESGKEKKVLHDLGPKETGSLRIDLSGLDPGKLCFGANLHCIEPAGSIKMLSPFGRTCQRELPKADSDLHRVKYIDFYFTLNPEQKRFVRENFSYARYSAECGGSKLDLPDQSPYFTCGGEFGGYIWHYKNFSIDKDLSSNQFSTLTLHKGEVSCYADPLAYFEGKLDPKKKEYAQIRNSTLHLCGAPPNKEGLYLSEAESTNNTKKNTLIFDDLPAELLSQPEALFPSKLNEYLVKNSTEPYRKYLDKMRQAILSPQEEARAELDRWLKKIRTQSADDFRGTIRMNLTFKDIDLRASCVVNRGLPIANLERCFRREMEHSLAGSNNRESAMKDFEEWLIRLSKTQPELPINDSETKKLTSYPFGNLDFERTCLNPGRWSLFEGCAKSVLLEKQKSEALRFQQSNNPLRVRCNATAIEDPAQQEP